MKQLRLAKILTVFIILFGLVAGPVQAAIYQDVLTVTTVGLFDPTGAGNDISLNVLGLDLFNFGQSFDLTMTYDSDTYFIGAAGGFAFGALRPANIMSLTISGTLGSVTFNETMDNFFNYTPPFPVPPSQIPNFQGPKAFYMPADPFDAVASHWTNVQYSAQRADVPGVSSVSLFLDDTVENSLSFLGGGAGLYIELDVDFAGFDPQTDRTAVPIPGTLLLLGPGLVGLLSLKRRCARKE